MILTPGLALKQLSNVFITGFHLRLSAHCDASDLLRPSTEGQGELRSPEGPATPTPGDARRAGPGASLRKDSSGPDREAGVRAAGEGREGRGWRGHSPLCRGRLLPVKTLLPGEPLETDSKMLHSFPYLPL